MPDKSAKDYTTDLIRGYNDWFWHQTGKWEERHSLCFWLGLIFGVLATITAAFPKDMFPKDPGSARDLLGWLVVLFTTLSTLFNATLVPKYKSLREMRDTGRIKLDEIRQLHELEDYSDEEQAKIVSVIKSIAQIEADFGGAGPPGNAPK